MKKVDISVLQFPIGKYEKPAHFTVELMENCIAIIKNFPENLKKEVENLTENQLDTPYRENGWTIRQVIHHCADSHMNSFIRFKLALTEDQPVIRPYFENRFAELADSKNFEISPSLQILDGLHQRWTVLLQSLSEEDLQRVFVHPEHGKKFSLQENIAIYAWHCQHHLAHITELKKSKNW